MKTMWLVSVRFAAGKSDYGPVAVFDTEADAMAYVRARTRNANMVAGRMQYGVSEVLYNAR